jgi:predicted component of type VI protein secretion system
MARSKRSSKKIVKGGEWSWDPRKWSFSSEPKTDAVDTPSPLTREVTDDLKNEQESPQPQEQQQPEQQPESQEPQASKPFWQFWGGKTKKSKSKGKKTRKARK